MPAPPHPQDSSLQTSADTGVALVSVDGEQDLAGREWLAAQLDAALSTGQPVVVDLSQATLIDSISISTILQAASRGQDHDQLFTVCAPIGSLARQVLSLLYASSQAHIADSLDAALEQFS